MGTRMTLDSEGMRPSRKGWTFVYAPAQGPISVDWCEDDTTVVRDVRSGEILAAPRGWVHPTKILALLGYEMEDPSARP